MNNISFDDRIKIVHRYFVKSGKSYSIHLNGTWSGGSVSMKFDGVVMDLVNEKPRVMEAVIAPINVDTESFNKITKAYSDRQLEILDFISRARGT